MIPASDLRADGLAAVRDGRIVLLEVSASYCGFCAKLEEEVLEPMALSGDYESCVIIRQLGIDSGDMLIDFDGRRLSTGQVADRYRASLTPTMLFLDHDGKELTGRMVGVNTVEFYGYYLDEALLKALAAAKRNRRVCTEGLFGV